MEPLTRERAEENVTALLSSGCFSEEMFLMGNNSIETVFPFSAEAVWKICYSGVSGALADELFILEAPDEAVLNFFYTNMQKYLSDRKTQFADYAPNEVPKLENAVLKKDGLFLIYCACGNSEVADGIISGKTK